MFLLIHPKPCSVIGKDTCGFGHIDSDGFNNRAGSPSVVLTRIPEHIEFGVVVGFRGMLKDNTEESKRPSGRGPCINFSFAGRQTAAVRL